MIRGSILSPSVVSAGLAAAIATLLAGSVAAQNTAPAWKLTETRDRMTSQTSTQEQITLRGDPKGTFNLTATCQTDRMLNVEYKHVPVRIIPSGEITFRLYPTPVEGARPSPGGPMHVYGRENRQRTDSAPAVHELQH